LADEDAGLAVNRAFSAAVGSPSLIARAGAFAGSRSVGAAALPLFLG
jgi:hypothetical protein